MLDSIPNSKFYTVLELARIYENFKSGHVFDDEESRARVRLEREDQNKIRRQPR